MSALRLDEEKGMRALLADGFGITIDEGKRLFQDLDAARDAVARLRAALLPFSGCWHQDYGAGEDPKCRSCQAREALAATEPKP